ncbi:MAG: methyltransferase domain-containing protein [Vicinamibacterales bacterium]
MTTAYVHGYDSREARRLRDQAASLVELLHHDTRYPAGSTVLEAGCGVGAQTVTLAANSPGAAITSIDVSAASLAAAEAAVRATGATNVTFRQANLFDAPFPPASFDHVFVCFVLEHLSAPLDALRALAMMLRPGGTLTVIEGDHGSAYYHPRSDRAQRAIQCLVDLQARGGGDALIGRALYPIVTAAGGFRDVRVSPRMVYADASRPALVEGFTKLTFTAMVEGVRDAAVAAGMLTAAEFDAGIADLYRTAEPDGTFCYTFFKATAVRAAD